MSNKNLYIVLGEDCGLKLEELLNKLRKDEAGAIELVHFYPKDSTAKSVDAELANMSFTARAFVFHEANKYKKDVLQTILSFLERGLGQDYCVFDYGPEIEQKQLNKDSIYKVCSKGATMLGKPAAAAANVFFDMINSLRRGDASRALSYVQAIVGEEKRTKSAHDAEIFKLLKGITTMLAKTKDRSLKRQYMTAIFETDRLLKESLVEPRIALERLLVKISQIRR